MDPTTINHIGEKLIAAHDALAHVLGEQNLFDEGGVEIIRLIARRLVAEQLGREPTAKEQELILGFLEQDLRAHKEDEAEEEAEKGGD